MGTSPRPDHESRTDLDEAVLRTLANHPRMHVVALSDAVGTDPATVDRACFRLQREGHVRARGGGDYAITAKGERRIRTRPDH